MKRILLTSLAAVLLATSCTGNRQSDDTLALKTREVDFKNKTGDMIKGKVLDLEVSGGYTISVSDTLMMLITSNPKGMLQVYGLHPGLSPTMISTAIQAIFARSPLGIRYAFVLTPPYLHHLTDVFPLKNVARANT